QRNRAGRAAAAAQPDAEPVREVVGRASALLGSLDDLAIGDRVADTDVHDKWTPGARSKLEALSVSRFKRKRKSFLFTKPWRTATLAGERRLQPRQRAIERALTLTR